MSVREVKPINIDKSNKVKIDKNGSAINDSTDGTFCQAGESGMSNAIIVDNRLRSKSQAVNLPKEINGLIGEVSASLKKNDLNSNSQIALSMIT